jgi:hypothetical protein
MHLKRLPPNQRPPDEGWDYIEVQEMRDGMFEVSAAIHFDKSALFGRQIYSKRQEAEQAGIDWAMRHEAEIVYLVTLTI